MGWLVKRWDVLMPVASRDIDDRNLGEGASSAVAFLKDANGRCRVA
jgi:hypothetical protein